jgi:predicted Fe-Mo cluster-binding NifX family protein
MTAVIRARDGFEGTLIGEYTTREGVPGVVLQQIGTRVVHVYREASVDVTAQRIDAVEQAITALLAICDASNWPQDAQSGPKYEAYGEITEQLHDIVAEMQAGRGGDNRKA